MTLPLSEVRVVDAATLVAGPMVATCLGEFGAEVIKVEQPQGGDPLRQWGAQRNGAGLMWKSIARNKKSVTADLRVEAGRELLRDLVAVSDVLIVNLRPSTMRRWGLTYGELRTRNEGLVMVHVTGFGAGGPKSDLPGFGTLGEAMSGFAHLTGQAGGPPTLPSFMLADGVAALTATYAVMIALFHRETNDAAGQLIDINLIEPLARLIEQPVLSYDQFGVVARRAGNRWDISAPRNTYRTADDEWIALSGSSPSIAARAMSAIGHPEFADDPRFADPQRRLENAGELDRLMAEWVAGRTLDDVMAAFQEHGVAAAPVYDVRQLVEDKHLAARGMFVRVPDPDLGRLLVQGPVPRLSDSPGRLDHLGPALGEHNEPVYRDLLGIDGARFAGLRADGAI